jgi:hypothetical protein
MLPADERVRRVIVSSLLPRAGACSETDRVDQTGQPDRVVKVSEEGGSQHRGVELSEMPGPEHSATTELVAGGLFVLGLSLTFVPLAE